MDDRGAQWLLDLWEQSCATGAVSYADLGTSAEQRRARWRQTLSALGWDRGEPRGSSRLLEIAVDQAARDGDVGMVLSEAFHLLGRYRGPLKFGLPWQCKLLWIAARAHGAHVARLWEGDVGDLTPSQAMLVWQFLGPNATDAEIAALEAVSART